MEEHGGTSDELSKLLAELSYRSGTFTLASGRESDFYVDVKKTVFAARGVELIGRLLCDRLEHHGISQVGGMAVGAIPLVVAALGEASRRGYPLEGFFVREQTKDHGTKVRIDGRFDPAAPTALVEDVVTTGGSTLAALEAVRGGGAEVSLIIVVVDREEDQGMQRLAQEVESVEALTTRSSILKQLR